MRHYKPISTRALRALLPSQVTDTIKASSGETARGFVTDIVTGKVAYVAAVDWSARNHVSGSILYRTAQSTRDYTGGRNQYCETHELRDRLIDMLS